MDSEIATKITPPAHQVDSDDEYREANGDYLHDRLTGDPNV